MSELKRVALTPATSRILLKAMQVGYFSEDAIKGLMSALEVDQDSVIIEVVDHRIATTELTDEEFEESLFAHLSEFFLSEKRVAEVKAERYSELKIVGIDQDLHIRDEAPIIKFVILPNC